MLATHSTTATTTATHHASDVATLCALASILRKGLATWRAIGTAERLVRRLYRWPAPPGVDLAAVLRPVLASVAALVRRIEAAFGPAAIGAAQRRALRNLTASFAAIARQPRRPRSDDARQRAALQAALLLADADVLAATLDTPLHD